MIRATFNSNAIPKCRRLNDELTNGNCHFEKTGICPLENITFQELENLQKPIDFVRRNERNYCLLMAKAMLNGTLQEYMSVSIYHFKCGHYYIDDGRHRICITEKLQKNNIEFELPIKLYEERTKCADCKRNRL